MDDEVRRKGSAKMRSAMRRSMKTSDQVYFHRCRIHVKGVFDDIYFRLTPPNASLYPLKRVPIICPKKEDFI